MRKIIINPGDKFNRLTVIKELYNNKPRRFLCKCECGNEKDILLDSLVTGHTKSCGCYFLEKASKRENVIGKKYGKLIVIKEVNRKSKNKCKNRRVEAKCNCNGNIKEYDLNMLRTGHTKSCGCFVKERSFSQRKNVIGEKFNRLTIIEDAEDNKWGQRQVMAKCECNGNIKKYSLDAIRRGNSQSCGCYGKEMVLIANTNTIKDYKEKYPLFCKVEKIRKDPTNPGILVRCKYCEKWFKPTPQEIKRRIQALENPHKFEENNFYCSNQCKLKCPLYKQIYDPYKIKSLKPTPNALKIWKEEVFKQQLVREGENFCEYCLITTDLHSHHVIPKKTHDIYALDPDNGIVLCKDCHYKIGHKDGCSLVKIRSSC